MITPVEIVTFSKLISIGVMVYGLYALWFLFKESQDTDGKVVSYWKDGKKYRIVGTVERGIGNRMVMKLKLRRLFFIKREVFYDEVVVHNQVEDGLS